MSEEINLQTMDPIHPQKSSEEGSHISTKATPRSHRRSDESKVQESSKDSDDSDNESQSPRESELGEVSVERSLSEFKKLQQEVEASAAAENTDPEKQNDEFDFPAFFEESVRQDQKRGREVKKMGVVFKDLTVVGKGFDASSIEDNLTPLKNLAKIFWPPAWFHRNTGTPFDILKDVTGFVKDGEMLLVLGRPGAGCSSLLRVIANQRRTFLNVYGEVKYGGISSHEFDKYTGEAVYIGEEDVHFPTLTVQQTLSFATKMKTPALLPEESKKTFRVRLIDTLLNMFGLAKQRDTIAGNEYIRGLSGGERKRLTISEAVVSKGAVDCWDCSTRGLDAASALDYAKSLRITTDALHKTTIGTFYQASENIYKIFDRVLVLEKGKCIYFGPTNRAKNYFEKLGFMCEARKSTPDFLTGITNPQERKVLPGYEDRIPQTSTELEAAWKGSKDFKKSMKELDAYEKEIEQQQPAAEFKKIVRDQKTKGTRKKSIYTASYGSQVLSLFIRTYQVFINNKFAIVTSYLSVVIQALVYSSVFYQMPLSATGGYLRGGAIFSSILFNAFQSIGEMAMAFMGRPILEKHKSYAFYHPSAYYLANVIMDIPRLFVQVALWSVISYFMYGLDLRADKFFIYLFTLWISAMCITQLFRLLGYASKSAYVSQQVLSFVLVLLLTYVGFTISANDMRPWLGWVYWINPIAYAFKGLFTNEMRGLTFDCTLTAVPYGPAYSGSEFNGFRVCTIPGARPGALSVSGEDFMLTGYGFKVEEMNIDIIAVFLFFILFVVVNCFVIENMQYSKGGYTKKVFKKGKAPQRGDGEDERAQAQKVQSAIDNMGDNLHMSGGTFMWRNIKYTVPVPKGKRLLLDDIDGFIKPGQMTALMGSSGAGKTTLLDVLAQRKTQGVVEGDMFLNGAPLRIDFERITGYVEQMDVFNPLTTVREALRFSAKLRQESDIPLEDKFAYVEAVLDMMEMQQLGDAIIGDLASGTGISVEERKRLTIGMELVAKPQILFLDEPTSGLDSQSSYNIIKFIRKLADAGMPLVCTIHQPSAVLFEFFDRLLLLARGGKVVYFGDIGKNSKVMLNYFESNGARHCSRKENPAEYILEAIGAGVHGSTTTDWAQVWNDSKEKQAGEQELDEIRNTVVENDNAVSHAEPMEFATGIPYQTWELYKRFNTVWWRSPGYNFGRLFNAALVGLVIGFSFWKSGSSPSDLQARQLAIFQILILGIMFIVAALPQFAMLRDFFRRDYSSKFYSALPFAVALIAVDLPYVTLFGTICVVCAYWSAGLDTTPMGGFYFWIMFILFFWFCISFGQLIGAISANVGIAMLFLPIFNSFLFLFAGVLAPPATLPVFWRYWMYWIDPFHWFLEGIITSTYHNLPVVCKPRDIFVFNTPNATTTCAEYTQSFLQTPGVFGQILNPNATSGCQYCSYTVGDQYYLLNDWSYDSIWRNFGILAAYWIFNIFASSVCIYLFRKQDR